MLDQGHIHFDAIRMFCLVEMFGPFRLDIEFIHQRPKEETYVAIELCRADVVTMKTIQSMDGPFASFPLVMENKLGILEIR